MVLRFQWNVLVFLFCLLGYSLPAAAETEENTLCQHLHKKKTLASLMPSWLDVQLEHRTRYETFNHSFKKGQAGSNQQIHQRTKLQLHIQDILGPIELVGEFADFRTPVSDRGQGASPIFVDHLDVFQLHADLVTTNFLDTGQSSRLEVGRLVLDFGKGRLVAGHRIPQGRQVDISATFLIWPSHGLPLLRRFSICRLMVDLPTFLKEAFSQVCPRAQASRM